MYIYIFLGYGQGRPNEIYFSPLTSLQAIKEKTAPQSYHGVLTSGAYILDDAYNLRTLPMLLAPIEVSLYTSLLGGVPMTS